MNEELQKKAIAFLQAHLKGCSVCGNNEWTVGELIRGDVYQPGGGIVIGGPSVPLLSVFCVRCAHAVLFSAVKAGIIERSPVSAPPQASPTPSPAPPVAVPTGGGQT